MTSFSNDEQDKEKEKYIELDLSDDGIYDKVMVNTDFLNKLENEFGYPPNDTPSTILSFNLKTLRNVYSYSQEDLANKLGISIRAYRSYEKGITAPGKEVLDRIHDIFKLEQKSIYSYDLVCSIIKHDTLSDDVKKIFNEVLPLSDKS